MNSPKSYMNCKLVFVRQSADTVRKNNRVVVGLNLYNNSFRCKLYILITGAVIRPYLLSIISGKPGESILPQRAQRSSTMNTK